jgi:hypothetical protein
MSTLAQVLVSYFLEQKQPPSRQMARLAVSTVQVKQEKDENLAALPELSKGAFKEKHGSNLAALKALIPVKGYIQKNCGGFLHRQI